MTINERPERIFTAERLAMDVDFFVKWRIIDTVNFYISTGGSFRVANDRISEIIKNAIVTEFGKRTVKEAISVERAELMRDMLDTMYAANGIGLAAIQIGIPKRIIVMDISKDENKKEPRYFVNPVIQNKDKIFYLNSRGLSKLKAEKILLQGIISEYISDTSPLFNFLPESYK